MDQNCERHPLTFSSRCLYGLKRMNNIAVDNTDVAMIVNSPADHMAHASLWLRLESSIGSVVMRAKLIKTMPMNTPSPVRALSARTTRRATISRSKSRSSESNTMLRPLAATAAETNAVEAQLKQCNDPRAAVNTHDQATVAPAVTGVSQWDWAKNTWGMVCTEDRYSC